MLPKDNNKSITVHGDELSAAISRVAQFADERSRAVDAPGKRRIEAFGLVDRNRRIGRLARDRLQRRPLTIGFNAQYLLDFLKATGAGDVKLEFKDSQSAGQLRPAEGEDYKYRYIVMPMRI